MATARHVARVHAGGGGAPPAATERHGGGGSVTPARTAARPPGTARPRPGRGGGRPSPRGGQTERGRWGGAARPSGPRGRRRGVLRRALSRALAAPGDARRSGVREGGGRRAPRLGAPPGVCSALARAGRAPSRQGRGQPGRKHERARFFVRVLRTDTRPSQWARKATFQNRRAHGVST